MEATETFRRRLRRFLSEHHPGPAPQGREGRLRWQRTWCATLVDQGFAAPGWPAEHGGMDLPLPHQLIYTEEMSRTAVPSHPGTGLVVSGPTIVRYGNDAQRARWLTPLLRADHIWAQAFSEPDAGSDLPSLCTRAQRDRDRYRVSGHKVWSSWADRADRLYTLVRTGRSDARQDGLSLLVIDARAPGVTIRPIRDMTGAAEFCEIFFDDVSVPMIDRIGEENKGWPLARTSLGYERAAGALAQAGLYRRVTGDLVGWARSAGLTDDPVVRQRLAALEIKVRIMGVTGRRIVADILQRGEPGPASSVSRLYNSLVEQELHELAVDLLGVYGLLEQRSPEAVEGGRWTWGFLRTRASTIGAGTAEIQRNTIAERVIGLPHDPALHQ